MKIIDDLFKGADLRWKSEKLWSNFALVAYHSMAFVNRSSITLTEWVTAYIMLHGAIFVTNGVKTFLDNKKESTNVNVEKADVSISN